MMSDLAPPVILVPIDVHGVNPASLQTLVGIARQLDCSLLGLFLEDIRLQRVADLPFTTEIVLDSGRERELLRGSLAQRHSEVVLDTRKRFTELAKKEQVTLNFDQAAGSRLHSALSRNGHLDIFFPARLRWRAPSPLARPAIVRLGILQSGGEQDEKVRKVAGTLARAGLASEIYVLAETSPSPGQLSNLGKQPIRICVQSCFDINPRSIAQLIQQSPYDLLILPRDCLTEVPPQILHAALEESTSQVLLVN